MMLTAKIAVNPLPWVLGPDGFDLSPATVTAAVAGIAVAGLYRDARRRSRRDGGS